jgi:spermidine synthase
MSNVEIRIIKDSSPNDIADVVRLYQEAGWWDDAYGTDFIEKIIKDSSCFAAVFENNQMIGMGRAISDGSSDAYIQDVTVLKAKRGRGIGKG